MLSTLHRLLEEFLPITVYRRQKHFRYSNVKVIANFIAIATLDYFAINAIRSRQFLAVSAAKQIRHGPITARQSRPSLHRLRRRQWMIFVLRCIGNSDMNGKTKPSNVNGAYHVETATHVSKVKH